MTIRIVRLKDGSDVISDVYVYKEESENIVELNYPMMFSVVNQNLVMQHWLPIAVMKGCSVKISREEVICFMEPNENFEEYYTLAVSKVSSIKDKSEEEMDELMEAFDELENTKGIPIH